VRTKEDKLKKEGQELAECAASRNDVLKKSSQLRDVFLRHNIAPSSDQQYFLLKTVWILKERRGQMMKAFRRQKLLVKQKCYKLLLEK
jgi:hypothetical protein